MAYSGGTSGCEPNICTHDLSCFPRGLGEIVRHHCVCTCLAVCVCVVSVSVCVSKQCVCMLSGCSTGLYSQPHTPNQKRAKQNNCVGVERATQVCPLHCVSLSHSLSISLSSMPPYLVLLLIVEHSFKFFFFKKVRHIYEYNKQASWSPRKSVVRLQKRAQQARHRSQKTSKGMKRSWWGRHLNWFLSVTILKASLSSW